MDLRTNQYCLFPKSICSKLSTFHMAGESKMANKWPRAQYIWHIVPHDPMFIPIFLIIILRYYIAFAIVDISDV